MEKDLGSLNDKLAFTLSVCNAKDEQVKKQTKIVQEAVAGNVHGFMPFSFPMCSHLSFPSPIYSRH